MKNTRINQVFSRAALVLLLIAPASLTACRMFGGGGLDGEAFASPQAAGETLIAALQANDNDALVRVFGASHQNLLTSGDPVFDQQQRSRFVSSYETRHAFRPWGQGVVILEVGDNAWPFPIPLIDDEGVWRFDTARGDEEILDRRIGKNELDTIQACLAFVDAERDYYRRNPRGRDTAEYARFILSSEGQQDGLYWPTADGEDPSPLGPLYAGARAEGYSPERGQGRAYHGYVYRVLRGQGPNAPGGARDYLQGDSMRGGFALAAWPARYGASGIKTFLVNQVGIVYEKDLGPDSAKLAATMKVFDPDDSWDLVSVEARALRDR
jgi:hypothetical protein